MRLFLIYDEIATKQMTHPTLMMRQWLDVHVTEGKLLTCRQRLARPKPLVQRMIGVLLK